MPSRLAAFALALLLIPAARADAPHPLTVEDLWKVQRLSNPAISPDGRWVAVEVTTYRLDANTGQTDIWLLSTDGRTQRPLVSGGLNQEPRWSPDGRWIAFTANRDGTGTQIYLISPVGGEPIRLTQMPMAPSGLKWSADGRTVYCIASTWPDTPTDEDHRRRVKERADSPVKALVITDAAFRYWDHWIADGRRPYVWAVDVATGQHRNLLVGIGLHLPPYEPTEDDYDVAPDGGELCFVADSVKEIGTDSNLDLYALKLDQAGAKPRNVTPNSPGPDTHPIYGPDGKSLSFLRQRTKFFTGDCQRLMVLERTTGKLIEATRGLDRSADRPRWLGATKLAFEMEDRGTVHLETVALGGPIESLTTGPSDHGLTVSRSTREVAFLRSSFNRPAAVYVFRDKQPRRIDQFNDDLTASWQLGKVESATVPGAGGVPVQMWLIYPPNFDPRKKWPLVQIVHGGPNSAIHNDFSYRWNEQLWAAQGWVVAAVNFHGSTGFGQAFADSITGDLGTKPAEDILKATDWLAAKPWIDKDHIAAAGGSYGGYMMAWLNGHTDRFRAMVCHAGVYDWHGMMASDTVRARQRPLGGMPWRNLDQIDRQSPRRYAAHFHTPTLVLHGEGDFRVPATQGLEYYNTLRQRGVPTRLVWFPDEGHWILRPQNSRLWHREVFAWLSHYIGRGPD